MAAMSAAFPPEELLPPGAGMPPVVPGGWPP
jgi:hypothetical protein